MVEGAAGAAAAAAGAGSAGAAPPRSSAPPPGAGSLAARAEVIKLERLLGADKDSLTFLAGLPAEELAELRAKATARIFDNARPVFQRLAIGAKLLPAGVAATIARREFGPLLCARLAGEVDPGRAIAIARKLDAPFLAEVSIEVDPRRVRRVLAGMPVKTSVEVAQLLVEREEWVTMGRFVGELPLTTVIACIAAVSDEALLRSAFVIEGEERLEEILESLGDERLAGVIELAHERDLWPEALDLLGSLGPERRARLGGVAAERSDEVLEGLIDAVHSLAMWPSLLPAIELMSAEARRRFAAHEAISRPGRMEAIIEVVAEHSLWAQVIPLVVELPPEGRERAAVAVAGLEPERIEDLVVGVGEAGLWAELLEIVRTLPADEMAALAQAALPSNAELIVPRLAEAADRHGLWEPGLSLLAALEPELREPFARELERLPGELRVRIAKELRSRGVAERLPEMAAALGV